MSRIHDGWETSSLGVLGGSWDRGRGHKNVRGVESEILLRTETSQRHTETLQGNPKLSGTADDDG